MEDIPSPKSPDGSFLTPLLLSLVGVLATSLIIVVYHIVMVKFCKRRHRNSSGSNREPRGLRQRRESALPDQIEVAGGTNYGLTNSVLEAIPIINYSAKNQVSMFRGDDQSECAICLGEVEDGAVIRTLPNCGHLFHVPCIDKWFSGHNSCPTCRSLINIAPIVSSSSDVTMPLDDENGESNHHTVDISTSQPVTDASPPVVVGTSGGRPNVALRHSVSFVLPTEEKHKRLITGLKRSLSVDQSDFIIINIQKDRQRDSPSSLSSSTSSSSSSSSCFESRQLDRVSFLVARSLSLIRIGNSGTSSETVLPL